MKKYWHTITVQNLESIQTKTWQFIKQTKERYNSTYNIFPWAEFTEAVPEILTAFDHLDMRVVMVNAYLMKNNQQAQPHKDNTIIPIRVNIPILNTENTWTTFWEPKQSLNYSGVTLPNGLKYYPYNYEDLEEQTRCEITVPTLIRPMEIHSVEFAESNPTPRITLTLVLDPIPYEYFPDILPEDRISLQDLIPKEWGTTDEMFKLFVRPGYL